MSEIHRLRKVIQWLIFSDVIVSDYDLAVKLGYKHTYLSQVINGKAHLSEKFIDGLLSLDKRINREWLLKGIGSFLTDVDPATGLAKGSRVISPLISQYAYPSYLRNFDNEAFLKVQPLFVASRNYPHAKYVAFEISCDNMDNKTSRSISSGDILLCREVEQKYWNENLLLNRPYVICHNQKGIDVAEIVGIDVPANTISCRHWNPGLEHNADFWLDLGDVLQLLLIKEISRQIN